MSKIVMGAVAALLGVVLVVGYLVLRPAPVVRTVPVGPVEATSVQLRTVAEATVFFAHQSVGQNIIDALAGVYSAAGVSAPVVVAVDSAAESAVDSAVDSAAEGARLLETTIGENGDPIGKIHEFDRIMRAGLAGSVDVAVLKLCFIDFRSGTDVEEVFELYRSVLAGLERDFPDVAFVHVTAPVAVSDLTLRVKERLGRVPDYYTEAANAARQQYNELIRAEYGDSERLFDLAAVQAAGTGDAAPVRERGGAEFMTLDAGLASDRGHLNALGAERAAGAFLATVADALS